jgi:hypothetical protein
LHAHGLAAEWRLDALTAALLVATSADLVRPAMGWLVAKATGPGSLVRHLAALVILTGSPGCGS